MKDMFVNLVIAFGIALVILWEIVKGIVEAIVTLICVTILAPFYILYNLFHG